MSLPVPGTSLPSGMGHVDTKGGARRRALTTILVVIIVALVIASAVLVALFTIPIVKVQRTSVQWFGWSGISRGSSEAVEYDFLPSAFCGPPDAIGNLSLSVIWQSPVANTTAVFFWSSGSIPDIIFHIVYWVNDSTQGGYSFPPGLSDFLCQTGNVVICHWYTPSPGAEIRLSGIREYNYTTSQPIW